MSPKPLIPAAILKSFRGLVHVQGWNPATVFRYRGLDQHGFHLLLTPKTHRLFRTKNPLTYTRRNAP
jgi:hypothetical protein